MFALMNPTKCPKLRSIHFMVPWFVGIQELNSDDVRTMGATWISGMAKMRIIATNGPPALTADSMPNGPAEV